MNVEDLEQKIRLAIAAQSPKIMKLLAFEFEEELLEKSSFPEQYFELLLRLFSDEKFCSTLGADAFVWIFYNDFEKLTNAQRKILLETLTTDFVRYKNKMLLHSIADLIARKYPPVTALGIFQNALMLEDGAGRYAALAGAEILAKNKRTTNLEKLAATDLIKQLTR